MYVPYRSSKNELTHFLNKLNVKHFTFHLQNKYSGKFANRKYEELSYPKNPKMCDPFPAVHPHKEVTPTPRGGYGWMNVLCHFLALFMGLTTRW